MSKLDAINIVALYAKGSANGWNEMLKECYRNQDTNRLARMRRALQMGMADAAKKKMNDEKIVEFFIRLQRSLENTMKDILRKRHPNPRDNHMQHDNPFLKERKWLDIKRKRDAEFEQFLKQSSY